MSSSLLTKATSASASASANADETRMLRGTNPGSIVDWYSADINMRELRQHNRGTTAQLERGHREIYSAAFSELVHDATKWTARALLDDLATELGLAWVDLAKMVGVSVPAIRKWRLDGGVNPENHRRLAEVWAFLTVLREHAGVQDPTGWISQRLLSDFTVTVRHLYSADRASLLLDFAANGMSAETLLNQIDPTWRSVYATEDAIVTFDDGAPAIVRRR